MDDFHNLKRTKLLTGTQVFYRRFDCPAFLRHSKTGQTNRLEIKPIRQRSQHPFPKSPRLHSRYVRSDFGNGSSLRPSSSNLIRSAERSFGGFLKIESR
jgi:hypothetical protein